MAKIKRRWLIIGHAIFLFSCLYKTMVSFALVNVATVWGISHYVPWVRGSELTIVGVLWAVDLIVALVFWTLLFYISKSNGAGVDQETSWVRRYWYYATYTLGRLLVALIFLGMLPQRSDAIPREVFEAPTIPFLIVLAYAVITWWVSTRAIQWLQRYASGVAGVRDRIGESA